MRSRLDIRQYEVCRGQRLVRRRRLARTRRKHKKKASAQLGEKHLPRPTRPGWGYRAESPTQGGRAGTFTTNVTAETPVLAESSNDAGPAASMLVHRQLIAIPSLNAHTKDLDQSHDKT